MGFRSSLVAPIAALTAGGGLFLALSSPACAAIGHPYDSTEMGVLGYTSEQTSSLAGGLTVYTMTRTKSNSVTKSLVTEVLRQVASPSGVIFGLSWSGIHHPKLNKLLDGRLPRILPFAHGSRAFSTPSLELRMAGTTLHSEGMAWDPALVPPGVSIPKILTIP